MNRYIAAYYHPRWRRRVNVEIEAESLEEAEAKAQDMLDAQQPLGYRENNVRVRWKAGIRLAYVFYARPVATDDDTEEIPF